MIRADYEISAEALRERLAAGAPPVLLDVRRDDEVDIGTLTGAVHVPMHELTERVGELDPASETVVFCHHGVRSLSATAFLRTLGFRNVRSLAGGIDRWSSVIDPSVPRY